MMRFDVLVLCSGVVLLVACVAITAQPTGTSGPTVRLPDPHHHVADVNNNLLGPQNAKGFEIVLVPVGTDQRAENVVTNPSGTMRAFSVCDNTCGVFFEDLGHGSTYQVHAPSFAPGRPFSGLVSITDEIFVFDQWTQPHYGVHYAVDLRTGKLLLASPFPDRAP